jgi:phosphinothricin acetyltransferase
VSDVTIRPARADDLEALNDLYNHYVCNSHVTFDIEPITMKQRAEWFTHYGHSGRHRLLVAVRNGALLGYTATSPYRPKPAYVTSVETSVYLAPEACGQGIGAALYARLFAALAGEDIHRAYAGIAMPNPGSVALHERFAFTQVGYFSEQGRKFGRYWDVALYERAMA